VHELDTIRNFITGTALTLVIDLFFVFVFLAVMWYYSPTLTWIVLATIPAYALLSVFITPILRHRLNEKFKHGAANTAFLTESITGIGTVKSMAVEPQMRRKLEDHLSSYVHASFRSNNLNNVANQVAGLINKLMTLGIIWWGAHLVMGGELTVGQLVAFNMLAGRVSGPVLKLVQLWQDFQQAGISIQRLGDILNSPREPGFNPNRSRLPALQGAVSFEQVNFRYKADGQLILRGVDLRVRPGEVVGVVGRSGSGKSTLTKLVQRLYVPESGRVLIDGVDLSMVDTAWLRRQIGVVIQENFLFNRSIRENIALVDPSIPMERVIMAARMSGAHEFITELSEGYDTLVGEQGSNLSGGQRQRLAIARALLNNPRILIFDEATSALDYESERVIQDNMARICQGRTVFVIAHRLSTVRQCDRIIVMDKGNIVEQGTHDQLIDRNGYYARLHSHQSHSPSLKTVEAGARQPSPPPPQRAPSRTGTAPAPAMREPVANQAASAVAEADEAWALKLLEELESEDQQTAHISEQHKQADILGLVQDDKSKGPER
ncbi:MAG: type I secretion system permease/ATPase, partial [Pseudomonas sp.]